MIARHNFPRRRHLAGAEPSIEFVDLLDRISAEPVYADHSAPCATLANVEALRAEPELADLVMFRIPAWSGSQPESQDADVPEPVDRQSNVSRFADAGIDDDRLPLRAPRTRRLHR